MPPDPAAFPRRVLLGIAGLTPQVVTETIWALARAPGAWTPTHLHVLTTREGARRIELLLLPGEDRPGALAELAGALGFAALPAPHIHLLHDTAGAPLEDIASAADNLCAADQICALVQTLATDAEASLHVSLAGGRKTMGFFAGAAMMLFGRPQDRLSHVLVNGALQAHPQFFFPPARPRVLFVGATPVSTEDSRVLLADIPFLRLRERLDPEQLRRPGGYTAAIAALQRRFDPPDLVIEIGAGRIVAGGVPVPLPPSLLGTLLWLAQLRMAGNDGVGVTHTNAAALIAAIAEAAPTPQHPAALAARRALRDGLERAYLSEKKTRINKTILAALGPAAAPYCIEAVGRRPRVRYRLATPPERIRIREKDAA